jgi:putative lipoprotein
MSEMHLVRGQILLPAADLPPKAAAVIVEVEDISRADAPSLVIGQERQTDVPLRPGTAIPFSIEIPEGLVDERHSYSVRVRVDVSGSGDAKVGDLVSTQTYPVLTRGHPNDVRVSVKRV